MVEPSSRRDILCRQRRQCISFLTSSKWVIWLRPRLHCCHSALSTTATSTSLSPSISGSSAPGNPLSIQGLLGTDHGSIPSVRPSAHSILPYGNTPHMIVQRPFLNHTPYANPYRAAPVTPTPHKALNYCFHESNGELGANGNPITLSFKPRVSNILNCAPNFRALLGMKPTVLVLLITKHEWFRPPKKLLDYPYSHRYDFLHYKLYKISLSIQCISCRHVIQMFHLKLKKTSYWNQKQNRMRLRHDKQTEKNNTN